MVAFVRLMLSLKNTTKEKNSSYNHITTKICNITAHWFFSLSENNSVLFLICIGNRFLECIFNVGWKCEELDEKETNISINLHCKKKKEKKQNHFSVHVPCLIFFLYLAVTYHDFLSRVFTTDFSKFLHIRWFKMNRL